MFYKIDVLKNFTKFAGKHLCWTLIFNKLHKKKALTQVFSCEFCENFNDTFFIIEHLWWLVLKIESLFSDSIYKSSHLELFWKKSVLRCALAWEFELFWKVQPQLRIRAVVESGYKLRKLSTLLGIYLFVWDHKLGTSLQS